MMKEKVENEVQNSNSYQKIKHVYNEVKSFHHHTHILYDIRTLLGPQPINYIELGSYVGGSAVILMEHPYPTNIICIDPCSLPKDHYKGTKNQYDTLYENLSNSNKKNPNTNFTIIKKLSNEVDLNILPEIDLLFLDGDHSFKGVIADFVRFQNKVKEGGFIVFDDYLDFKWSPDVKRAVDKIVKSLENGYEVIGSIKNYQEAFSNIKREYSNEFILYREPYIQEINDTVDNCSTKEVVDVKDNSNNKEGLRRSIIKKEGSTTIKKNVSINEKPEIMDNSGKLKLAVIVATYYRKNRSTINNLKKLAETLKKQDYKDFRLFLIGDDYENLDEWDTDIPEIFKDFDTFIHNNPESYRDGSLKIKENLWTNGGMKARYYGIKKAMELGYDYYIHIDDDDIWNRNHIKLLVEAIEEFDKVDFLYTRSRYENFLLPREEIRDMKYNNLPPKPRNLVHSTTCTNLKTLGPVLLNLYEKRFDRIKEFSQDEIKEKLLDPFDMIKWSHFGNLIKSGKMKCLYLPLVTCTKKTDRNYPK